MSRPTRFPDCMFRTLSSKNSCKNNSRTKKKKKDGSIRTTLTHTHIQEQCWDPTKDDYLTVLWGSMLPILRAFSIASSDGLQTIGVFGSPEGEFDWEKWPIISNISYLLLVVLEEDVVPTNSISSSSSDTVLLWVGFRVSKQMIPSKQSSRPSLLRALTAWTLSAFVNIYFFTKSKYN